MTDLQIRMLIQFVQLIQLFTFHPDIWHWQGLHKTVESANPVAKIRSHIGHESCTRNHN